MTAVAAVCALLFAPITPSSPHFPAVSPTSDSASVLVGGRWAGRDVSPRVSPPTSFAAHSEWGRVTPRPGPAPFFDYPKEAPWPASAAVDVHTPPDSGTPPTDGSAIGATSAADSGESSAAPTSSASPVTLRERALNRFAELGAPAWVIAAFDCIGRNESGWTNSRSKTGDSGTLQINDVHRPELDRLGLDPMVPEDAATFAWRLFTRAGWSFRDWVVAPWCGLR